MQRILLVTYSFHATDNFSHIQGQSFYKLSNCVWCKIISYVTNNSTHCNQHLICKTKVNVYDKYFFFTMLCVDWIKWNSLLTGIKDVCRAPPLLMYMLFLMHLGVHLNGVIQEYSEQLWQCN